MKLADHANAIRIIIEKAMKKNLDRIGIQPDKTIENLEIDEKYIKFKDILITFEKELNEKTDKQSKKQYTAYDKLVEELTFTLFNRIAALKVMEAHSLHPEIITRRNEHGDRSFAHKLWLEQHPDKRNEEMEALIDFCEDMLMNMAKDNPLFSLNHPFHLMPTAIELNEIFTAFNQIEKDSQVEEDIWKSDDVLGWLYESYNNYKKAKHKESKAKTEYDKVSIQSQVYTPRWVVKFLVDNSLGKLYLEMYPDSVIKEKYQIANISEKANREIKPLHEVKLIDPACGSGNFLLYAFDLFYDLYTDQIENYDADYDDRKIPELIIQHNLHGIDLDDRAVQLAQFGLFIKAKRRKSSFKMNIVNLTSSDFYLPEKEKVLEVFSKTGVTQLIENNFFDNAWDPLNTAYRFGSLLKIEDKISFVKKSSHNLTGQQLSLSNWGENQKSAKQMSLDNVFTEEDLSTFFNNLRHAISISEEKKEHEFFYNKTADAVTFIQLLTQEYDIAVANPPYTDSSDFGTELKAFIEENYKKPYKFNANLYATFIKRCYELINENGKMALIHPRTFMFIKSFEDVRKFIIEKTSINILVDYGTTSSLFGNVLVDPTFYILSKSNIEESPIFIDLITKVKEKEKKILFFQVLSNYIKREDNKHIFKIQQSKLKIIEGYPFIYWISDGFREKFKEKKLDEKLSAKKGLGTENLRFFRYFWEINKNDVSVDYIIDKKKWVGYLKGGPYCKWYGNLWLVINWDDNGKEIKSLPSLNLRNPDTYFKEGIACSLLSSKGTSFRYQPKNYIYDSTTRSIFLHLPNEKEYLLYLSIMNSKLVSYILNCLNSTVVTNSEDIHRIPDIESNTEKKNLIELANLCIWILRKKAEYSILDKEYIKNPLFFSKPINNSEHLVNYLNFENYLHTIILINEAIINEMVFEIYELSPEDRQQVEEKEGKSIGGLPVSFEAKEAFLAWSVGGSPTKWTWSEGGSPSINNQNQLAGILVEGEPPSLQQNNIEGEPPSLQLTGALSAGQRNSNETSFTDKVEGEPPSLQQNNIEGEPPSLRQNNIESELSSLQLQLDFINQLEVIEFDEERKQQIINEFPTLYQSNNNLEEFCIKHQVNPINVWYWFKESKILPAGRAQEITLEFLADAFRTLLMQDEDGIIPLVHLGEEISLYERLEQYCMEQGFTSAQFMQLDSLLGRPMQEYIDHHFFKNLSDHLNLFMYLPKTPFIWHLCSGEHQGFEAYIIIYKWNKDSLYKLKSNYISKRIDTLQYRQIQLAEANTAQAIAERDKIRYQLAEIETYLSQIDNLLETGYNPILDDGVGKNIAPLQKRKMLRCDVLNDKQLERYLNADW